MHKTFDPKFEQLVDKLWQQADRFVDCEVSVGEFDNYTEYKSQRERMFVGAVICGALVEVFKAFDVEIDRLDSLAEEHGKDAGLASLAVENCLYTIQGYFGVDDSDYNYSYEGSDEYDDDYEETADQE